MKKHWIYVLFLMMTLSVSAQINTFHFNENVGASQWHYNPALQSKEKLYVSIPVLSGFHFQVGHTGFSYKDAIKDDQVNFTNIIHSLDEDNHLLQSNRFNIFGIGLKQGAMQFRLGMSGHLDTRISYTKDLIELLWKGNGHPDLIGRRLSMDDNAASSAAWLSYFVGGSRQFLDGKLHIGMNLKLYQGIATSYTKQSSFGIRTDHDTYAITADGSFNQQISGINILTEDADPDIFIPFSAKGNYGFGTDLGLSYSPKEMFTIEASIIDLGKIRWKKDIENYTLSEEEVTYSGIELNEFFTSSDSITSTLEQFADSISELFEPEENFSNFSTPTNSSYFLRGVYHLTAKQDLSAFVGDQNIFGKHFTSAGAMYTRKMGKWLTLSGGLQFYRMKDPMIPLGFLAQWGPVQMGIHTDNVLTMIMPLRSKYASGTFFLGLRFKREKPPRVSLENTEE
ncbi:MAG: hypothetical protein HKN39_06835 [Flavobacteriales bacterium]|nr:hypothetical protein [Flavobacteriales bacterium]